MRYNRTFREGMLRKLLKPDGPSVSRISEETGVRQTTLYRWLRDAKSGQMKRKNPLDKDLTEKFELLRTAALKKPEEMGAWMRTKGIHGDELKLWEKQIRQTLEVAADRTTEREKEREIKALRKELTRKEQALAEMSALLVLKKKVHALFGDGE